MFGGPQLRTIVIGVLLLATYACGCSLDSNAGDIVLGEEPGVSFAAHADGTVEVLLEITNQGGDAVSVLGVHPDGAFDVQEITKLDGVDSAFPVVPRGEPDLAPFVLGPGERAALHIVMALDDCEAIGAWELDDDGLVVFTSASGAPLQLIVADDGAERIDELNYVPSALATTLAFEPEVCGSS
ncbi:MAG: hypothetical protein AAF467_16725 [Actinomycetota bacterium]